MGQQKRVVVMTKIDEVYDDDAAAAAAAFDLVPWRESDCV